jgi:hypothetical protein
MPWSNSSFVTCIAGMAMILLVEGNYLTVFVSGTCLPPSSALR